MKTVQLNYGYEKVVKMYTTMFQHEKNRMLATTANQIGAQVQHRTRM